MCHLLGQFLHPSVAFWMTSIVVYGVCGEIHDYELRFLGWGHLLVYIYSFPLNLLKCLALSCLSTEAVSPGEDLFHSIYGWNATFFHFLISKSKSKSTRNFSFALVN